MTPATLGQENLQHRIDILRANREVCFAQSSLLAEKPMIASMSIMKVKCYFNYKGVSA